jgi:RNA polymerase sigma-70 factor, ECF subfamily
MARVENASWDSARCLERSRTSSGEMQDVTTESEREQQLIQRAQGGDRSAFDELTRSLTDSLLASIRRRIGPALREHLDPEDALQETLLRAFRSVKEFRWQGEKSFQRWLEGISANFILHTARKHGLRTSLRIERRSDTAIVSPSRHQRREERFDRLKRSIDLLKPEYRDVVRLARIEGLKVEEIAGRLSRTPSSVRNLLLRAMRELRESFGDTESLGLPDRRLDGTETSDDG